ncbi:MAG: winged helix-turn-helix domain-containing tetratricopeptide repeat protein [Sulfurifustis sp.]
MELKDFMEQPSTRRTVRFGDYLLDPVAGRLQVADRTIALRPKAFEVLFYLAERSGHVVAKEELLGAVWPNLVVTDDSLVQCVSEIRRALNDDRQQIIRTLPRRGYIFTPSLREVGSSAASANSPLTSAEPRGETSDADPFALSLETRGQSAPMPVLAPEASGSATKGLFARARRWIDSLRRHKRDVHADVPFFTLAVLPLRGNGLADESCAAQLTANLTLAVSRIPGSFVIARNIAEKYEGKPIDPKQVGRELNIRYVVQGSVERSGEQLQLMLELVDTQTGQQVWAEHFGGRLDDLVIERIARRLNLKLYDVEAERRRRERPLAPRFDDLIVRGFSLLERQTVETIEQARQLGLEAVKLEPRAVSGWVVLAFTYFVDLANRWCDLSAREEWTRRGREAAGRAYALNPDDFHAIGVWAWALEAGGRLEEATAAVERQIAMNPSFTVAFHRLAYLKMLMGEPEVGIALEQQVLRFTPIGNIIHNAYSTMAICLIHLGRDAEAIEAALSGAGARPVYANPYAYLAAAAGNLGDLPRARAALAEFRGFLPKYTITAFRRERMSERPAYLAQREHFYEGLRKAGLEE